MPLDIAFGRLGQVFYAFSQPVTSLGYAVMLWNVIASPSLFEKALSLPWSQRIGRWSYSLYLWHWWPCVLVTDCIVRHWGQTLAAQYAALAVVLVVLLPIGKLSYDWFESPYFTRWRLSQVS